MDESEFLTANTGKTRVVSARGTKTQHKQSGADRENVTAIVIICTDGTTVKLMIIYKGKNFMQKWNDGNVAGAYISHSENGWTDEKITGRTRVLILDGHSSHYTLDFIQYACENNILVLGYPLHCTHALQGLDMV
ncbi:hypothetical protein BDZ89DRAFT_1094196 [Hymenopellis radicata]|nr:hypothetical protein BDZ89DRAFT_1094196 [Hymenopellis radicata]